MSMRDFKMVGVILLLIGVVPTYAVINGNPAPEKIYNAVGSLRVNGEQSVHCTATLINSKWIITAKHCTDVADENPEEGSLPSESNFEFRLGYDFKKPVFKSKIARWVTLDSLNDEKMQVIDIAFAELMTEVPLQKLKVIPVKMLTQSWDKEDLASVYTHIGYGVTEPFSSTKSALTNKRQRAEFRVTSIEGNALINLFNDAPSLNAYIEKFHTDINLDAEPLESIIANAELMKEYSVHAWDARGRESLQDIKIPELGWQDTCFGDSGGPLLRRINDQIFIVGVVSHGMNRTCASLGTSFTVFGPEVQKIARTLKSQ